jgi:hypothetical protein
MSNGASVVLLLLSLFWTDPAAAQIRSQDSPAWVLSVHDGSRLTANVNRIPLRLVLEELARQAPLRLSVSGEWHDQLVTAHFHALPLDEALAQLLSGFSYAIVYAAAPDGVGPAATTQIVELMVLEKAPAKDTDRSVASAVTSNTGKGPRQGATLDTPPEWTTALQHPDTQVRLQALQRWAEQGAATPLNPLTYALVDPDESVRARAQELVEHVLAAKAEAR